MGARWLPLVVIGVALLVAMTACDEEQWGNPQVRRERQDTWTFEATAPLVVDAETSNGAIIVLGATDATEIAVTATLFSRGETEEEAWDRLGRVTYVAQRVGGQLTLRYRGADQDEDVRRFSGAAFSVAMPQEGRLLLKTANGAIRVEGIRGHVTATTSNGAVDLYDIEGSVLAETSNGRLQLLRITGDVRGSTSNGEVWLEAAAGAVDLRTSNGGMYYTGTPVGASNRLHTSNGSITVRVPSDLSLALRASTSEGGISSPLPLEGDTEGTSWDAVLNPPAETLMTLQTSNGLIRIDGR
jgi:hypothetical protein